MRYALMLLMAILISAPAIAADKSGGYTGPTEGANKVTVKEALDKRDDTVVQLTGNIVSKIAGKDDKYMFRDATGEIKVDIDRKVFHGLNVSDKDTVCITGKVDKDLGEATEIDVKQLEIVNR